MIAAGSVPPAAERSAFGPKISRSVSEFGQSVGVAALYPQKNNRGDTVHPVEEGKSSMNNQQSGYKFRRAAVALTAMGGILSAMPASAEEFKFGDSTLTIDSIASVGISLRASGQDCMYISAPNGGCTDGIG